MPGQEQSPRNWSSRRDQDRLKNIPLSDAHSDTSMLKKGTRTLKVTRRKRPLRALDLRAYKTIFEGANDGVDNFNVLEITAEALECAGRLGRRKIVVALADIPACIELKDGTDDLDSRGEKWIVRNFASPGSHKEEDTDDLATVAIIALAMRSSTENIDSDERKMVTELLALSPPKTMECFCLFRRAAFLKIEDIVNFVHVVARNVAHDRLDDDNPDMGPDPIGSTNEPIGTLGKAGDIVAAILRQVDPKKLPEEGSPSWESHATLYTDAVVKWPNDVDRGIQVGLVLAGIRKYFNMVKNASEQKYKVAFFMIDVALSGLSAVPVGGIAFSLTQAIIGSGRDRFTRKRLAKVEDAFEAILNAYYTKVEFPLHRNNMLRLDSASYRVDVATFTRWLGLTVKYNGLDPI